MAIVIPKRLVLSDDRIICDAQNHSVLQVHQIISVDNRMTQIQTDSEVAVRQYGRIFNHGSEIDVRVTLHIAASRDERLLRNLYVTSDEYGWNKPRSALHIGAFTHPHSRPHFKAVRSHVATRV